MVVATSWHVVVARLAFIQAIFTGPSVANFTVTHPELSKEELRQEIVAQPWHGANTSNSRELSEEELALRRYRLAVGYTIEKWLVGYECFTYFGSGEGEDFFFKMRTVNLTEVDILSNMSFECSPLAWLAEVLNCDEDKEDERLFCSEDGTLVFSPERAFRGNADCTELIATMNWLHGEAAHEWELYCKSGRVAGRVLADTDDYPNNCQGNWRECPYTHRARGIPQWRPPASDQWFHLHAHSIQGNEKFQSNCVSGDYADTANWVRWKRAAYTPTTLVDITESGATQRCVAQPEWMIHVKGRFTGKFGHQFYSTARSTHTCYAPYKYSTTTWYDSDSYDCLYDLDIKVNPSTYTCAGPYAGPRNLQKTSGWKCP